MIAKIALLLAVLAGTIGFSYARQSENPSLSALQKYLGQKIARINFEGISTLAPDRKLKLVKLKEGDPLTREGLRGSVQALYDSGFYSNVEVQADTLSNGNVALTFITNENYFVGSIWIEGAPKAPPTHAQLVNATKLQLGELITEPKLADAVDGVRRAMDANGYHQASVQLRKVQLPPRQQMELTFAITPGKIAHVGEVQVTGAPGYSPTEVEKISGLKTGKKVGLERTRKAVERMRKKYQKHDFLEAQLAVSRRAFDPATNTEDYVFNLDRGPKVEITVQGAKISHGTLKKYIPVFEENAVDPDLLNEGSRNLRDYLQTQGYFDAAVDYREEHEPAKNLTHIVYVINKGVQHKLEDIAIDGNQFFDEETLRARMNMRPATLTLRHGRFSQALLARDIASIENTYHANGFEQIAIKSEVIDDYRGQKGHIKVVLHISEGLQTRIAHLEIAGNRSVPTAKLLSLIGSTAGQPFSDETIAIDRETVLGYYLDLGFLNVQFETAVTDVSAKPPLRDVTYEITEGEQTFVANVFTSGLHFTRPHVAEHEIQLAPRQPLSQTAMFESQRRLYDLGLFNEVNVAIQNPDGVAPEKNVLFQMEEAKRYTFVYGFGIEAQTGNAPGGAFSPQGRTGVSPRVSFDVTRINFFGRDHTLLFKSRYGRLEQEGLVSYEAPRFMGRDQLKFILTTFYDETRDVRTFTAQRLEGSVQFEQHFSTATTLLYGFLYRRVKVDPLTLAIDPNQIPLLSRPVRVGMPNFTVIRDKRLGSDGKPDPLDPHTGSYNTFDGGASSGYFGSEASFSRFLYTNSTYHELTRHKWVLARNTRIGLENTFGSSTFVPLPERFFAGGANSIRGFALNQAGPRDAFTGFPLGGQAVLLNQLELRFPAPTLPFVGNNLSPVLFHDAGNVFSTPDEMFPSIFRVHPKTCTATTGTCDFNYFNHAVGLGFRYRTPVGPVRLDVGYSLNPTTFPVRDDPTNPVQTLRRFNFYFSIGQSF